MSARIAAVSLLLALTLLAWRTRDEPVRVFALRATPDFWRDNGYVEMVPPVRLPGRAARELHTSVWLRLPEHGLLTVATGPNGRPLLHYPAGTDAVRVEIWEGIGRDGKTVRSVADARGEHFALTGGPGWFVLKPASPTDPLALRGVSWPRDDREAHLRADRTIVEFSQKGLNPAQSARIAARVQAQNACPQCHVFARADAQYAAEFGEVARGTDGAGLFQIQTVLSDHAPIEAYAPRELNLDDPAIEVRCGDAPAEVVKSATGRAFRCAARRVPIGYLNVPRALSAGDPRVRRLCEARRYLHDHFDMRARAMFDGAFRACGITK